MLLLRNSPSSVFTGSALFHLEVTKRDKIKPMNPPIWNSGKSVYGCFSRCPVSNPRMSLFTDHADSDGEATDAAFPLRCRRISSLSDGNFTASTCRNSESAEASSLLGLNTWTVSHPSLDEASKLDIACLENPVENSVSAQQIQIQLESDSTLASISHPMGSSLTSNKDEELGGHNVEVTSRNKSKLVDSKYPLGSSLISIKVEELDGVNVELTSRNRSKFVDSFVGTLHENYPLVSSKIEGYKYSTLEVGPNGVPLFCTARGCRVANVFETEHMSRGSGIARQGRNCEAAEDQNSKNIRDLYYQSMLEENPGNPLLLSNYAKFLHEVQHDIPKAEEYYGRAILASPEDAEVLSLYAKFTWETYNDAARAETYFAWAVKATPDDCYVLSSYAHFLWDSEEEEDHNDGSSDLQNGTATTCIGSVSTAA